MTVANLITMLLLGWFLIWCLRREMDAYRDYRDAQETQVEYVGIDDLLEPGDAADRDDDADRGDCADRKDSDGTATTNMDERGRRMPAEPAYQFPGIPDGWTLDRYAHDGIQQVNLHLAQAARRNPPPSP